VILVTLVRSFSQTNFKNKGGRKMRKIKSLAFITALLFVSILLGAPNGTALAEKIKIGFSMYSMNAPYFVEMRRVAKDQGKKLGIDLAITDAEGKVDKQLSDVEDLITQKCDAIILMPMDAVGSRAMVRAANKADIPIIAFNNKVKLTPDIKVVTTWLPEWFDIGKLSGLYAGKLIGKKKVNMVLINGRIGSYAEWARKFGSLQGIMEYQLEKYNRTFINVIAQGWGNWSYDGGLQAMEDILAAHAQTKIDVILAENDSMALGSLKAMKEAGRLDELMFLAASCDGQKQGLEAIMKGSYQGKYVCSGINSPGKNITTVLKMAVQVAKGKTDWPAVINPEPELATKKNVKEYYNPDSGF